MTRPAIASRRTVLQFARYIVVGAMNTLLTLILIFIAKNFFGINEWVSNAIGYVGGFINSFVWNKLWVFRSSNGVWGETVRFVAGFLICYALQLGVTWVMAEHTALEHFEYDFPGYTVSGYAIATLIGMVAYTLANYVYNRAVTFRASNR